MDLNELVNKFVQNEIQLSVAVSKVYSETISESIWIMQDGKITSEAQAKADAYKK